MIIGGQHFSQDIIGRIQATIDSEPMICRHSLSQRVCQWLNWKSPNGKLKEMACRVVLNKLHNKGIVTLPPPMTVKPTVNKNNWDCPGIATIEGTLDELRTLDLIPVGHNNKKLSNLWNGLMETHHYLGAGPLCGAQIRYLIWSENFGWLGGLAFSAAAWRVEARDKWIGWSDEVRQENLSRVVCNSRFLIAPQVRVPNLASRVLSMAAKRIGGDWQERYGFEPVLLETFIERDRFKGTGYRAANWQYVGMTQGRGRQDQSRAHSVPIKDVYLFPLRRNARKTLCSDSRQNVIRFSKPTSVSEKDWAEEELGRADFGDKRLRQRLIRIARDFYARPQASVPQACQERAGAKAVYRFLDHPRTTMEEILKPHYEATITRMSQEDVILAVQDTTQLDYSTHPATENLGPIGTHRKGIIGLHLHDTVAFNTEGTPMGALHAHCWARDPKDIGKKKRRYELPIEQKESNKWLLSYRKTAEAQRQCPQTMLVSVGDREADVYELFDLALKDPSGPKLLVRATQNRRLVEEQGLLFEKVAGEKPCGIQVVYVPRQGSRRARDARLEMRFSRVTLKAPDNKIHLSDRTIWAVLAREIEAPEGIAPLEWTLLTTCEVNTFEQATEKLRWYALRWGIEVYHKILKSGCKIEQRQLGCADRIESCLAIDMVVAWRIYHLTKLGRETPDVPCTVYCEDDEWKALYVYKYGKAPEEPPDLRTFTRMVASLGGFLGRKCDGEPGTKTIWLGLQCLDIMTAMYKQMISHFVPHQENPPVSSNPGYG